MKIAGTNHGVLCYRMRFFAVWAFMIALPAAFGSATNFFELDSRWFNGFAAREIRADSVNQDLLGAAILRETNEHRRQRGLVALKNSAKATEAARIQSDVMRARGSIGHENPENPRYRTLELRVKSAGLKYRFAAENVATAAAFQYASGQRFYVDRKNGRTIYRYKPGGPSIPPHTYATFAKELVNRWMGSKGHRANILHKEARYLGVHCSPATNKETGMPIFYCTQVFFTPPAE